MLAVMFSGRHSLVREADGSFFLDRDGTHFRYILNFLRDGGFRDGQYNCDLHSRNIILNVDFSVVFSPSHLVGI